VQQQWLSWRPSDGFGALEGPTDMSQAFTAFIHTTRQVPDHQWCKPYACFWASRTVRLLLLH